MKLIATFVSRCEFMLGILHSSEALLVSLKDAFGFGPRFRMNESLDSKTGKAVVINLRLKEHPTGRNTTIGIASKTTCHFVTYSSILSFLSCRQGKMAGNTGIGKMHMDLYTNNSALTQKAKFWCNFVSSLKGNQSFCCFTPCRNLEFFYPGVLLIPPHSSEESSGAFLGRYVDTRPVKWLKYSILLN